MAVNLVSPVISYRNTLRINGYNRHVLKGSFELMYEISKELIWKFLKMLSLADVLGMCSVNQALPAVQNIFELTNRGKGVV